ncbi:MAG: hypothetical protein QG595_378 [Pseudomonadota bacterium]|nr:hypothetical protein [Pseudomonadota bacterium]
MKHEAVDVVIVGAGAAGCLYAAELARAGKRVTVLEAGPAWTLDDLISSQIWARRLKWRGAPVAGTGDHPVGNNFVTGSGFGGAALHHYGTWPRFLPENFEVRRRFGKGLDWPISHDELRPWYDRIQAEMGISGDAQAETWRGPGDPYPMPAVPRFGQGEALARGFLELGKPVAPLPVIVNSVPYRDRPACLWDGWCDAGCPTGALANPLVTWFKAARAAGAEFHAHCDVKRVMTDKRGHATGVEYFHQGERHVQRADVVILAASTIGNPRILLNSVADAHPAGLANASGLVGRYLMAEFIVQGFGLFREQTQPWMGISAGQLMYREGYVNDARPAAFGGYQWQLAPAMKPNDLLGIALSKPQLFGPALQRFLETASQHIGMMIGFGSGVPERDNRVELDAGLDREGYRLARTVHRYSAELLALWKHMQDEARAVFSAAGARDHWTSSGMPTGHVVGGTIMGTNARDSVCDSFGRTHEVRNLLLAGAGLFPCSGGASPTFTIHAVSLRSARQLIAHWSDHVR